MPGRVRRDSPRPVQTGSRAPRASAVSAGVSAAVADRFIAGAQKVQRSDSPEGSERVLTARQADRAKRLFDALPPATANQARELLGSIRGEGAEVTRALVLKALAARADVLPTQGKALDDVKHFAARLAELTPAQRLERTSVLDLDSRRNTSASDPIELWNKAGTIADTTGGDTDPHNDGLFQRFTASCGSTVLQMMMAEADPVLALQINDGGRASDSTTDFAARFQRSALEQYGGLAIGRRESYDQARLHNALGQLGRKGLVSSEGRGALSRYAAGHGELTAPAKKALDAVRGAYDGFPADQALARLRALPPLPTDEGISVDQFQRGLDEHLATLLGVRYQMTQPVEGFARGKAGEHLDAVERALRSGVDVPFGIQEPAHWMLLTNVRQHDGQREFLVSDPDGGRTLWVGQADLVSGRFADRAFHLSTDKQKPYVDCFYLPLR